MRAYAESNFPLELARRQEEVAQANELLALAESGVIELVFPAIALTEPFSTLLRYANDRARVIQPLNSLLGDLSRSQPHQPLVSSMSSVVAALTTMRKDETNLLEQAVSRMLKAGRSLPLTEAVFAAAQAAELQFDLAPQDAIVFASIARDLASSESAGEKSCFISKNSRDFTATRAALLQRNCHYLTKFSAGLGFVRADIA